MCRHHTRQALSCRSAKAVKVAAQVVKVEEARKAADHLADVIGKSLCFFNSLAKDPLHRRNQHWSVQHC